MQKKSFDSPDKTTNLPKTRVDAVEIGGRTLLRNTFEPGWKWSVDVKPAAGTDSCHVHHVLCIVSGHLAFVLDDGTKMEAGPGDVVDVPAGHDAWVVGEEAVVCIDVVAN